MTYANARRSAVELAADAGYRSLHRERERYAMKRFFLALAIAALGAAVLPGVAAAGATCTYSAANHKVTLNITGAETNTALYRVTSGAITLNGNYCGAATITNTDTIAVTGDAQPQEMYLTLSLGLFVPGFTNEPGSSDEIEITIDLGGGEDTLRVTGNDNVNKLVFGQDNSQAGTPRKINLNGGESTGVDGDVTMTNVENLIVYGQGGNDVIRAQGKTGAGPDPLTLPMLVHGGPGADMIKGGNAGDRIYGDAGKDEIWGFGGGDFIHLDDGAPGDIGHGGATNDLAYLDAGDTWYED